MLRRETSFATNTEGKPIGDLVLSPSTEYVVCRDEDAPGVPTFHDRTHLADWLQYAVLGDLRTLVYGIEARTASSSPPRNLGGGNFLLAAGCCMALEYFGQVYGRGSHSTDRARAYTKRFLDPIDSRYSEYFWLLWTTFRNGIVHGSWPQGACLRSAPEDWVAFGASNTANGEHFGPGPGLLRPNMLISSVRFVHDLDASFANGFRNWVLADSDDDVLSRASARLVAIAPGNDDGTRQFERIKAMYRGTAA
jgi:hypothetical protein